MLEKRQKKILYILIFWSAYFYGQGCGTGISSFPYNQSFENTIGNWVQSTTDNLNWTVYSGGTPSNSTGPSSANHGGYYIYVEASNYGTGYPNKRAIITSPCFDLSGLTSAVFNFDYHMYGSTDMGTIDLEISTNNGNTWTSIWNQSGNQGNSWSSVSINLSSYIGGDSIKLRFNRITGSTWQADIAIDNVSLEVTTPPIASLSGYLGPGGVGSTDGTSSLKSWFIADTETGSPIVWKDLSGNNEDCSVLSGQTAPTLESGTINSYNTFSFNNDQFQFNRTVSNDYTLFCTFLTSNSGTGSSHWWQGKGLIDGEISGTAADFGMSLSSNSSIMSGLYAVNGDSSTFSLNSGFNDGLSHIALTTRSTLGSGTVSVIVDESTASSKFNTGTAPRTTSRITIGSIQTNINYFTGKIPEVIAFDEVISSANRIIINNYLSAKYNVVLTANDFYNEDTSGGNFDHNVAGIGQASDGSSHTDSQGTGIVRINTPSDLNNDEFLFWGEDVKDASYDFSSSAATNYIERLDTKWRVSKRNDLGTVSVSLNSTDILLGSGSGCNDLKLIVSNFANFSTKTTYDLTFSSGTYTATDVLFNDNDYFTIEYVDLIVIDGTTAYNGAGESNVPDTNDDCYKLLVKSTADGTPSLTENADVREVEIESGGKLILDAGTRLQVTNGIQLNGEIRLIGSSQLIQTHTGESQILGSGNLYIDQNSDLTSVYRYNYWTSPVVAVGSSVFSVKNVMKNGTNTTATSSTPTDLAFTTDYDGSTSPLTLSSYWIYGYLNSDGWTQKLESGTFNPGEGYLLKSPGIAQNYTFVGTPNDGDITFSIDADKTSLLGNPYPSALDANLLFTDSSNLATIYFWEHKNEESTSGNEGHYKSGYIGGYSYRNAIMGTAADSNVNGTAGLGDESYTAPGRYIPVGQGFFAEAGSGLAATVNFKNSQRFFETEAGDSHFFKSNSKNKTIKKSNFSILKLGFESQNNENIYLHSQIGISFSEGKSFVSEIGFDSRKAEIKDSDIYFKFQTDGDKLVIAGVEEITEDLLVPITLQIDTTEDVFLMLDEKQNINSDIFIFDAINNTYHNLNKPLQLNLEKNVYSNRFYIAFSKKTLTVNENVFNNSFKVYQNEVTQELIIKNLGEHIINKASLYSITGKNVIQFKNITSFENSEVKLKTNKISSSAYILKINTSQGVISKIIFIR